MKRFSQDDESTGADTNTPAVAETFRSGAQPAPAKNDDEKMSLFWRVFGGTILSIVALVGITVFNNIQSSITDLRNEATRAREALATTVKREDLDREREARAGLAKKEDVDARIKTQYERIRAIETLKVDFEGVKDRAHGASAAVEAIKKEYGLAIDTLKRDIAAVELVRERMTVLVGEVKLASEAVSRVQSELEKNKASDLERKLFRDAQSKTIDDAMRDLQRAVQDCREKLARLEGAGPTPRTPARPPESKSGE